MPSYDGPLSLVVERINATSPVEIEDPKNDGEWFHLQSNDVADRDLFRVLKGRWRSIVSFNFDKFALIHCQTGHRSGVWLHYLATPFDRSEYRPGCHQISSW